MKEELQRLEESTEVDIYLNLFRATLNKVLKWETLRQDGKMGSVFKKKFMSIHDILALQLSKCREEVNIPEWMTKGKSTLIQEDLPPPKKNYSQQPGTNNVSTYDVENSDWTN